MRGRPFAELLLVGLLGLVLWFPLRHLTRPRVALSDPVSAEDPAGKEEGHKSVWIDLRFSHEPERFEVFYGDTLLGEGAGELRWDEDVEVPFDGRVLSLRVTGVFPEEIESAYLELAVEPEALSAQRSGIWTRGRFSHKLDFRWQAN